MKYKVSDYTELHAALKEFCEFLKNKRVAEESVFDCKLVISELAGNILQHSDGSAEISAELVEGKIRLEICGEDGFTPPERSVLPGEDYADHGRGLYIVDKFSESRMTMPSGAIRIVIRTFYKK